MDDDIYVLHGHTDRMDYLNCLADDYCKDIETVLFLSDLLGPEEDFDGLPIALQDDYI